MVCDECGHEQTVVADYSKTLHHRGNQYGAVVNEGQVKRKLQASGWRVMKKKTICPDCVAVGKQQKENEAVNKDAAEPTRKERRDIMDMLESCYDTDSQRYRGTDTDDVIADALDVRPAWVAEIREQFFGPAGGNEEIETLIESMTAFIDQATGQINAAREATKHVEALRDQAVEHVARLKKIEAALTPRIIKKAGVAA